MGVRIVLATRNGDKVREIRALLAGADVDLVGLSGYPDVPEAEESGDTLEENALIKARAANRATGLPSVSDDTGLEVSFLGGRPGVRSSRYAGEDVTYEENNRKLVGELTDAGTGERGARFRCIAAFVDGNTEVLTEGICVGEITLSPRGRNGFGYDPLFLPAGSTRTFAEMTPTEKNALSHRALAFRKMAGYLRQRYPQAES